MPLPSSNYLAGLPQPYRGLDPCLELSRLSADISYTDKALIKLVCPKKGILMQMTQIFFSRVCEELRTNNITHYTPENEQHFIRIIERLSTPITLRDAATRVERTTTPGTCAETKGSVKQRGDVKTSDKQTKRSKRKTVE